MILADEVVDEIEATLRDALASMPGMGSTPRRPSAEEKRLRQRLTGAIEHIENRREQLA